MLKFLIKSAILIAVLLSTSINAQTFGFGCLGFVGGFGGYSYQNYKAEGLNNYVAEFNNANEDSLKAPMGNFGTAAGYRVGINFFRAHITGFILTSKGFYQSLLESKDANVNSTFGASNSNYKVRLNTWGVGFDVGTSISGAISWKVIDAALLFNKATFTNTKNSPGSFTDIKEYKSNSKIGYSIGTGFILQLIDEYISIEGLAAYTVISIDELQMSDGTKLTVSENSSQPVNNFIDAGGFNAVIQLNVGFPL
ncbi:MAG: hypothetical protein WCE54_04520 [Ignavibacteriaceae bacterium]